MSLVIHQHGQTIHVRERMFLGVEPAQFTHVASLTIEEAMDFIHALDEAIQQARFAVETIRRAEAEARTKRIAELRAELARLEEECTHG